MSDTINPAAPHDLPVFFTSPGQTDILFNVMAVFVVVMVLAVIVFYFKLHALPERLAHGGQKIQFEIVAVLALISLFTHNHLFWIAGLLLALIPIPDFSTPLTGMDTSLAKIAGRRREIAPSTASGAAMHSVLQSKSGDVAGGGLDPVTIEFPSEPPVAHRRVPAVDADAIDLERSASGKPNRAAAKEGG